MAEERLLDTDIDKNVKYKIRINEDGEEELYTDEEVEEIAEFEVPDFAYDDEEATTMTPEQFLIAMEQRRKEEEKRKAKAEELKQDIQTALNDGDMRRAEALAEEGIVTDETGGLFYAVKLRALTNDFTDTSLLLECAEMADGVKKYATEEQKAELYQLSKGKFLNEVEEKRAKVSALNNKNEQKRAERRAKFIPAKKRSIILFSLALLPFIALLVVAICFSTIMFARQDGAFIVLTIVFATLAVIFFILTVFFARNMVSAIRRVRLNEDDRSTELGRKLIEEREILALLERIYNAVKSEN